MTPQEEIVPLPVKLCMKGLHVYDRSLSTCEECRKINYRENYLKNKASINARHRAWYARNKEEQTAKRIAKRAADKEGFDKKKKESGRRDYYAHRESRLLKSREYNANNRERTAWRGMIKRCQDPSADMYYRYGGRGIKVCDRWLGESGFLNFLVDMGKRPSDEHSIDRRDNDKDYCPENCKWSTVEEQARNKERNVIITYDGKDQCLTDWAREIGISVETLWARVNKYGWSVEKALSEEVKERTDQKHAELVRMAASWLQEVCGSDFVLAEPSSYEEVPDAIGWKGEDSHLVECKTSRDDFWRDSKKEVRLNPELGMGVYRYYMVPEGLILPNELPDGWGLLYVNGYVKMVQKPNRFKDHNYRSEGKILVAALRRAQLRLDYPLHEWLKWDSASILIQPTIAVEAD